MSSSDSVIEAIRKAEAVREPIHLKVCVHQLTLLGLLLLLLSGGLSGTTSGGGSSTSSGGGGTTGGNRGELGSTLGDELKCRDLFL